MQGPSETDWLLQSSVTSTTGYKHERNNNNNNNNNSQSLNGGDHTDTVQDLNASSLKERSLDMMHKLSLLWLPSYMQDTDDEGEEEEEKKNADDGNVGQRRPRRRRTFLPNEKNRRRSLSDGGKGSSMDGFYDEDPPSLTLWQRIRSLKRDVFLVLTEPNTSILSAIFFGILVLTITMSNVIMIIQTMRQFQYFPEDCTSCGGEKSYMFEDDDAVIANGETGQCVCPPAPHPLTIDAEDYLIYFFSIEWILRVLCYEPPPPIDNDPDSSFWSSWRNFLLEPSTVLDFLAIFPYYLERFSTNAKGLLSLRLLRLFRVFQLVRLGQFNSVFMSLQSVLIKSLLYLRLLLVVLAFGAAFFGSMIYWLEKGEWKYWEETGNFEFIRKGTNGVDEEISPFVDIPHALWWFLVTATTVGYGDMYPTSYGGKCVAALAMLTGVLVIAFPVSVFSDLWSREIGSSSEKRRRVGHGEQSDGVAISPDDVRILKERFQAIEENQQKIREIFNKYDID